MKKVLLQKTSFLSIRHYATTISLRSNAIQLRPYQEHCLQACTDALMAGAQRLGVSLPTGSGKTTVFVNLLSRIQPSVDSPDANRSLIIVNSIELAHQTANTVAALFPSWSVEIEQGAKYKASGSADVTVATYQTLLRSSRLEKFDRSLTKAVIVDEAHHAVAPSYQKLLSHFHLDVKHPGRVTPSENPSHSHKVPIIGFSATFSRHDGLALGTVFEKIVYHRDFLAMIKEEWLCNVRFTCVKANLGLSAVTVNSASGDFNTRSLGDVVNTETMNNLVVQTWLDRAAATRKSTLVFCVNISHVRALTKTFRDFGIDARLIHADTPSKERASLITDFRAGRFPVLVNCAILTEGADVPNIDCVVVARPTRSRNVFAQMIGRGMRLSPNTGKDDCHVIDFVDSTSRAAAGVMSMPTLFGLDPNSLEFEDMTAEEAEELAEMTTMAANHPPQDIRKPTSVTYVDYDDPFSLIGDGSGVQHVNQMSPNAWVNCGADVYILECLGKGYIRIEPATIDEVICFKASFTPASVDMETARILNVSPYRLSRRIMTAQSVEDAIRGCDTYVRERVLFGPRQVGLLRSAKWRLSPATKNQKEYLQKRWGARMKHADPEAWKANQTKLATLTKGQAANMITRIRHGALGRHDRQKKLEDRDAKKRALEEERHLRTVVRVGPLSDGT